MKSIEVQESTGHKLLDDTVVKTVRQWRFKPHRVDRVRLPMTFTLTKGKSWPEAEKVVAAATGRSNAVLYAPTPGYPLAARSIHWWGRGIYQLKVRANGTVSDAKLLRTTGNALLDNRAMATLRTWRFRPGAITVVDIPVAFILTTRFAAVIIR